MPTIRATFTWDAENRLVAWDPYAEEDGARRYRYKYDHRGRRVERLCQEYNASTTSWDDCGLTRYVWADWLLIAEIDVVGTTFTPSKQFTWGLDLSGTMEGGGPRSAQWRKITSAACWRRWISVQPGRPGTMRRWCICTTATATPANWCWRPARASTRPRPRRWATRPYGTLRASTGTYADENQWRFSTKQFDVGADLYYYGYRYYHPRIGRWARPCKKSGAGP